MQNITIFFISVLKVIKFWLMLITDCGSLFHSATYTAPGMRLYVKHLHGSTVWFRIWQFSHFHYHWTLWKTYSFAVEKVCYLLIQCVTQISVSIATSQCLKYTLHVFLVINCTWHKNYHWTAYLSFKEYSKLEGTQEALSGCHGNIISGGRTTGAKLSKMRVQDLQKLNVCSFDTCPVLLLLLLLLLYSLTRKNNWIGLSTLTVKLFTY